MLDGEDKIVKDAVGGEASAFGLLYDHYQPKIYRFVLVKVSRREEAEDLTHQVFLSAWQNVHKYKDFGHPFSSWLYRIARNQVIDYYRSGKNTISLENADPELFASSVSLELSAEHRLSIGKAHAAIRTLKQEYQDVLLMRYVEELAPKEIARALGKSEGAVKLIQHRAIKSLKEIMNEAEAA